MEQEVQVRPLIKHSRNTEFLNWQDTVTGSLVEATLRIQRQIWPEIAYCVSKEFASALPPKKPTRLVFCGVGSSFYAAKLAAHIVSRSRTYWNEIPVHAIQSMEVGAALTPRPDDLWVGITHRGGTAGTHRALELARERGAFTVAVVGEHAKDFPAAKLRVETTPQEQCEPHTMSMTGAVCAATTLLIGEPAVAAWIELSKKEDPISILDQAPSIPPTVILGEWEGEWLAREGALKLMEMARIPMRAYGSEEFFHGPRLSFKNEHDRIWHIVAADDARAADLMRFPVDVRIEIPKFTGVVDLGCIEALVHLQWHALSVARKLRVQPDGKEN